MPESLMSPLADRTLFIDGEAIILDKPAGLPVDPPRDGSLSLENHLASLTFGFQRWPVAVHRLDRDTSGCLLLARNPKAHKRFAAAFEAGTVKKLYLAVLEGVPSEQSGRIEMPLAKVSSAHSGWRIVASEKGKAASTDWQVVTVVEGHNGAKRTLVAFRPQTGRTHQIRVHAASGIGLPIVGDPVYGQDTPGTPMLLHAAGLSLARDGKPAVAATAPLPERFLAAGFTQEQVDDLSV